LSFEKQILSVEADSGDLYIWDVHTCKIIKKLSINCQFIYHPSTYLNKLVYTSTLDYLKNKLFLYNFNTEKELFNFDFPALCDKDSIQIDDAISCMEQSPVVDILAVGFTSGKIVVVNIKTNTLLMTFESSCSINCLSFSNSTNMALSLLASSGNGEICFWDLNKKALHYSLKEPHGKNQIENIKFLPNENIFISSSGENNSLKMWVFARDGLVPSLLKYRSGHSLYPNMIRFYGDDDNKLISASKDGNIRSFSLLNEHQSCELSYVSL